MVCHSTLSAIATKRVQQERYKSTTAARKATMQYVSRPEITHEHQQNNHDWDVVYPTYISTSATILVFAVFAMFVVVDHGFATIEIIQLDARTTILVDGLLVGVSDQVLIQFQIIVNNDPKLVVVHQGQGLRHVEGILQLFHWCQGTDTVKLVGRGVRLLKGHDKLALVFAVVMFTTILELQFVLHGATIHEFAQQSQTAITIDIHQEGMWSNRGKNDSVLP